MEHDPRSFQSVNIGLCSIETGKSRFTHNDIYTPPPLSHWRNNLTALSQRNNLYFVASNENVIVYKPEFPFQKLGRMAHLAIPPALANANAGGYIDRDRPHSINHLVIDDLGTEEILLVATDSGNITAYYTKSVEAAIRKDPYRFSTNARSDLVGVRPFFSEWVYESAWGLSIHTQARMIAVSANTPHHIPMDDPCAKITVFAFALSGDHDASEDFDDIHEISDDGRLSQWNEWEAYDDAEPPPRDKNYKITLAGFEGHDSNIPSVAFVNTEQDPDGRWLLSTDIEGNSKIWQIWQGSCHNSWNFAEKSIHAGWLRRREGGWAVTALDPRCFRTTKTMEAFCGHSRAPQYHGHVGESYDITNIVRLRTPGNSHAHPLMIETSDSDESAEPEADFDFWPESDDQGGVDLEEDPRIQPTSNQAETSDSARDSEASTGSSLAQLNLNVDEHEQIIDSRTHHDSDSGEHSLPQEAAPNNAAPSPNSEAPLLSSSGGVVHYESSSDGQDEGLSSSSHRSLTSLSSLAPRNSQELEEDERLLLSPLGGSSEAQKSIINPLEGIRRPWSHITSKDSNMLHIPMLHCSVSNLRLLDAPNARSPHLFCANILKQALPPIIDRNGLGNFERLNMVQQIPELGVVVIASQIGRCAICSLTRNDKTGTLGLRVDWILPTRKQEAKMLRPVRPLLGIAMSPIQGRTSLEANAPIPDQADSVSWGKDGVLDGVSTTFDPVVLVLRNSGSVRGGTVPFREEDEAESSASGARRAKRKRLSYEHKVVGPMQQASETRQWTMPECVEPWQPMENSRRYRLMLTYSDWTVFTYEISRGVERDDVAQGETSVLDLVD